MRVLLISTYDLGRQPFGLASPAAWLREVGAEVDCLDLAVESTDEARVRAADLIAFFLPMHTATRIAIRAAERVRQMNPQASLCFYGLYASMNETYLRAMGADHVLGGEFETGLARLVIRLGARWRTDRVVQSEPVVSFEKQRFRVPDRRGLPTLARYAHVHLPDGRTRWVGYTEATRGCKHRCRHCPVVPVYGGKFRVVQADVVLADIRQQVEAGAEHITFGDPDFWNGIGHSVPLVRRLHQEFPRLTYDVTIKIEHLLRHREHLTTLRDTGCLFVTSAVESIDDQVLALLEKGHTRADFVEVVRRFRAAGMTLNPTFIPFHPWSSIAGYRELLGSLEELDLVEHVAPIQLAIRLLVPAGSLLLELPEVRSWVGPFDADALIYPWMHRDPAVDALQREVQRMVARFAGREPRGATFARARRLASGTVPEHARRTARSVVASRATVPYLTEPWYC